MGKHKILSMLYADCIVKKMNQLRKRGFRLSDYIDTNINNCSSPGLMSVLISFFMLMIFFFEQIGLLNSERNVEFRIDSPESVIKGYTLDNYYSQKIEKKEIIDISGKLRVFSEKDKEENIERIRRIMIESALEQPIEEVKKEEIIESIVEEEKENFFDL